VAVPGTLTRTERDANLTQRGACRKPARNRRTSIDWFQDTIFGGTHQPPTPTKVLIIEDFRAFGNQLRTHRRAAGLSQQELADLSGLSIRAIGNLERGRTRWPYRDSLLRLADSLELRGPGREEFLATGRRPPAEAAGEAENGPGAEELLPPAERPATLLLPIPRSLPADVPGFIGREPALAALTDLLPPYGDARVAAVSGTAGVGKTALAVHWAHRAAPDFPDGQLYVNLRGYDSGPPRSAADALAGLLRALGVEADRIPDEVDERSAVFRSVLAERKMLLLLDNARDAEQVRPLLPGTSGSAVVVTSRDALAGLIARDGAVRVELDLLPEKEAESLLRRLVGPRAEAEPRALGTLAAQCCRLPLALRVAAELAAARGGTPLAELVAELTDVRRRLDVLDAGGDEGTAVRTVLSWSYRQLDPSAARALRLVSLHPGADFDIYAAAALTGSDLTRARQLMDRLARAYLVHPTSPERYELHDLLRGFAQQVAEAEDDAEARHDALAALFDYYLHASSAAMNLLFPVGSERRPKPGAPTAQIPPIHGLETARSWLDGERANLTAAVAYAEADERLEARAVAVTAVVERYVHFGRHLADAATLHHSALRAARRGGDRRAEATALSHLGFAEWEHGRHGQAADYQKQALALFRDLADELGQARTLHRLALIERTTGHYEQARAHAKQVLTLSRKLDDRAGQSKALNLLGTICLAQGQYTQAQGYLRESLALLEELSDHRGRSVTVKDLGVIELRFGRLTAAAALLREARALCQDAGNRSGEAEAVSQLGLLQLRQGRPEAAIEHQERAVTICREVDHKHGETLVLARYAAADVQAGRPLHAIGLLEQALRFAKRLGTRPIELTVLNGLGEALLAGGRADRAPEQHTAALELAERMGDFNELARAHHGLARTHAALGSAGTAERHARAAYVLYAELGVPEAEQVRGQFPAVAAPNGSAAARSRQ
jgi:tetratricopeptide (TPR) repeat protein/transcriptional regulator with XRE-family HTH domain